MFLLVTLSAAVGGRWQWIAATVVGTFLVQTHVGYAPLVAGGLVWAGVLTLWDARGRSRAGRHELLVPVAMSALAASVLWIPVIVEQIREQPGNLTAITDLFLDGDAGSPAGWRTGFGLLAAEYRWDAEWLRGSSLLQPLIGTAERASSAYLIVLALVLAVGAVAALRSGSSATLASSVSWQ